MGALRQSTKGQLGTAAVSSAGGDTLIRADASVSWFPPRSVAEQLTAARFRSVTVTATEMFPRPRALTRTVTSPVVIGRRMPDAGDRPSCQAPLEIEPAN